MCPKIESLSNTDLLGVLVGPRHAVHLLRDSSGSLSQLLHEPLPVEYAQPRVASKLKAAAELVRRSLVEAIAHKDVLASPAEVRTFLRVTLAKRDHEVFMVLFLDAQNRVIASEEMFRGTLTQTSVYPREVAVRALHHQASSVVLAHNHPSGTVQPSRADEALTQTLKAALALLDVRVLDHIIVGPGQALSMAEKGLL
jgi:DNA repair protein RadC